MIEKTILVTGASSGIGLAAATGLHQRGWQVFATARTQPDLDRLSALGLTAVHLDFRDPGSIPTAAASVLTATAGKIGALFNNAGYGQPGAVEDLPSAVLRDQFEINVFGWHGLTRALIPAMRANGGGRIVNCSSVLGIAAMKYRGAYVASKFALEGLTDALRLELRGSGIEVSTIRPGPIASRFVETSLKAFETHIDRQNSAHAEVYARRLARMQRGGAARFKLAPEAVVEKLIYALESPRPRPYYAVTTPTLVMTWARRLLPDRMLIRLLANASDRET